MEWKSQKLCEIECRHRICYAVSPISAWYRYADQKEEMELLRWAGNPERKDIFIEDDYDSVVSDEQTEDRFRRLQGYDNE